MQRVQSQAVVFKPRITPNLKRKTKYYQFWRDCCSNKKSGPAKFIYPNARRDDTVEEYYHGVLVKDPYRWLEDPASRQVKDFIKEQNKLTEKYLNNCAEKEFLRNRLSDLYDFPKYSCPTKKGKRYYFFKSAGLQSEMVIYQQDTLESEARIFLNLNISSENGTLSLMSYAFSEDGDIFCYSLSSCGSDWLTIHFRNVNTNVEYPEVLKDSKFTNLTWTHDNLGIFYSRYLSTTGTGDADGTETGSSLNQKLFYHRLGTKQEEDFIVVEFPENPKIGIQTAISHCGKFLIIFPWETTGYNALYYARIMDDNSAFKVEDLKHITLIPIFSDFSFHFEYVTNTNSIFYFLTNDDSPNNQVVGVDLNNPQRNNWKIIIPERERDVLNWAVVIASNKLIACHIHDVKHTLTLYSLEDGKYIKDFDLELGTITCRSGKRDEMVFFFRMESVLNPIKIFYIDFDEANIGIHLYQEVKPREFDAEDYTQDQIFYTSKDGTQIPMYIVHNKKLTLDGTNFCRLYAYGGFGISTLPSFVPHRLLTLDNFDGVYAVASIRGGGEYGENWHMAGALHSKQNCLDDLIAAAEYLIKNDYTNPTKLSISGSSNGGLVVAACVNQRPELFASAIAAVGVMDLLRFHKFTVGYSWIQEYGCSGNKEDFDYLYKISPLHNIKPPQSSSVQYPAVFVASADHDNRVVPLHSLKYTAQLQHEIGSLSQQKKPLLLKVTSKAGHGGSKSNLDIINDATEIMCFLMVSMKLKLRM